MKELEVVYEDIEPSFEIVAEMIKAEELMKRSDENEYSDNTNKTNEF